MAAKQMHNIWERDCSFCNEYMPAGIVRKPVPAPGGEKI